MLKVIARSEIRARTRAMREAVPEEKRPLAAQAIREYADAVEERHGRLDEFLRESFGDEAADVLMNEINTRRLGWERGVADRLEGLRED
jgi:D-alanine-D-alanine ligase-like ATP-grasp enzyme